MSYKYAISLEVRKAQVTRLPMGTMGTTWLPLVTDLVSRFHSAHSSWLTTAPGGKPQQPVRNWPFADAVRSYCLIYNFIFRTLCGVENELENTVQVIM
jgi:hypothetical protein